MARLPARKRKGPGLFLFLGILKRKCYETERVFQRE